MHCTFYSYLQTIWYGTIGFFSSFSFYVSLKVFSGLLPPDSSQTICLPPIHRSTVALIWKILNVEDIKQYAICIKQFFSCPEFCRRHFWHNPSLPASTFFYLTTSPLERALKDMVLLAIHWQKHKLCLLILAKWSPWSLLIGKIINLVGGLFGGTTTAPTSHLSTFNGNAAEI